MNSLFSNRIFVCCIVSYLNLKVEILIRDLIIDGAISARIDSQKSAVISTHENQRSDFYKNVRCC